ncbi:T9SS type B sorting domain-containing protein [Lutibacter citreus]|uniref:T9SS type B sorting domain-containing protein n=1 Tax=Lutibacter citreus TaxID=2138210 RepID=UPI001300A8B3|nr:T9SS type B sorting domain-containing protein [Lutibacter citreus]
MNNFSFNHLLFTFLCLVISQISFAQLSKTHYIPPLTCSEFGNANPESQYIYISTPSENEVPYTVIPVGGIGGNISGFVSKSTPKEIYIGTGYSQLFVQSSKTSSITNNKGYIVEAEGVIYVSIRMNAGGGAQAGALVSKGLSALGKEFRVGSFTNENPQDNYLNFVSVMATEDRTKVDFSNLPSGLIIKNYSGTTPVSINLDKGESYILATNSFSSVINRDGLIGCLVSSDKDIVVNCGSANGSFHNGNGRDYGIDQIVGIEKVGTEYIFVKGDGRDEWENILIVAHTNGTSIKINGTTSGPTLNAGEYYLIEGNIYNSAGNMYVETSAPVFAYQGVGATTSEANQGMFFVPPLSCETRGNVDNIAAIESIGTTYFTGGITIVTKKNATVTINGNPISNYSSIGPSNVNGKADYVTYKVTGLFGNVSVECDDELYCSYFNYNGSATSGSFYSGFPTAPEINFDAVFKTKGICIPNITLEALNSENFDTLEWFYDDGSGFKTTGNKTNELIPLKPGRYRLDGYINCTKLILQSFEVPLGYCPDDIDDDGIIDNLDIDNDNDGILNCTESKGDVVLNLTNTANPIAIFNDGSTLSNLATGSLNSSNNSSTLNSFTGNSNGNFKSVISATSDGSNNYKISFTKNINFKFSENTTISHSIIEGEKFIVRIAPTDKNITLIDPDNRLLVDTNFDEIFEKGVSKISGSEIHFKVNPSPTGKTPFQFFANSVSGFSFIHELKNTNKASTFNGVFSLTCYFKDNDNDGIEDSLDLDSDNDGIPDIIENSGKKVILRGVDIDENGLDDVFDIISIPIDTDNDKIVDFYDLDSDNDGIYDLFESGSNLPDTNFDGIIDNINKTIGLNGWDNNAESSPDSNIIGYTLNDKDNDLIFSYIDSDSDGDECSDVLEAGFSDSNNDTYLGNSTVVIDENGIVSNATDGYTLPNSNYGTFSEIIIIEQPKDLASCIFYDSVFEITTNSVNSYQWQISKDNGTTWNNIVNDEFYAGAETEQLIIKNTPFEFNNYKFRVQLKKDGNFCGAISEEAKITVNPVPIANSVSNIELCDNLNDEDDTNGIVQNFNLETQTKLILGTQSEANYTVTYHLNKEDAASGENHIISPFENISSPHSQTIFVSVLNNKTLCRNYNLTFNLIVNSLPKANAATDIKECDNLEDGDDFNGIVQSFNLESNTNVILGTQPKEKFSVSYHLSKEEAITGNNPLSSPHSNKLSPDLQTIYVRVLNKTTGCVNPHSTFNVIVNKLPIANLVNDLEECDNLNDGNDTNGIIQNFNLESLTSVILGTQNNADFKVTYHLKADQAISGNNPISSPFENKNSAHTQKIYVRILNKITGCVNPHLSFNIIVNPLPILKNKTVILEQCDDDEITDGFSIFNLNEANQLISKDYLNETFEFYLDNGYSTKIEDPIAYKNPSAINSVVFVKIITTNGCERFAKILLKVGVTQIPPDFEVLNYYKCENLPSNNQDGKTFFNFSDAEQIIKNSNPLFSLQSVTISFYGNLEDALSEINKIEDISNYQNTTKWFQKIYVRIDSDEVNACLGLNHVVTLNVEPLPIATPITIKRQCDDNHDGFYPFDVSTIDYKIRNGQKDVTIRYFNEKGIELPSPLPNPFLTKNQTIKIKVTNNNTNTTNGPCSDETELIFIVDDLPQIYPLNVVPVCDEEDNNDGIYDFDTSSIQTTLLRNQKDVEIHYYDQKGNELSSPLPNPFTTFSQTISVEVINPINRTCKANSSFDLIVNELPEFEVTTPQIICITAPQSPLVLTPNIGNLDQNSFEYSWHNENGKLLSNEFEFNVFKAGLYYITLTKNDGSFCSRTKEIQVNPSAVANFGIFDIDIVDDSENNTITIKTDNLGIGDYEFSLDNENFLYQDKPFFEKIKPGIHTIYIRDKNECGIKSVDVPIIGYPKFFTPNNDGHNDTWKVIGVNDQFYGNAKIYIFDRFGKLVHQVKPNENGWDGTLNGRPLPSSDYWFTAELIDIKGNIRIKKSHFSLVRR